MESYDPNHRIMLSRECQIVPLFELQVEVLNEAFMDGLNRFYPIINALINALKIYYSIKTQINHMIWPKVEPQSLKLNDNIVTTDFYDAEESFI